jgi:hypothetical protein
MAHDRSEEAVDVTKALHRAFEMASSLPEGAQDDLAAAILDELEMEEAFDRRLAETAPALERLANEALAEHRAGLTTPLDPDDL